YTRSYTQRVGGQEWEVYLVNEVRDWIDGLDQATHARVVQAIDVLAEAGPQHPAGGRRQGRTLERVVPRSHPAGRATLRDLPERTHRTRGQPAMSSYTRWTDIRAAHVERAGGEQVVEAGKQELLATVVG